MAYRNPKVYVSPRWTEKKWFIEITIKSVMLTEKKRNDFFKK